MNARDSRTLLVERLRSLIQQPGFPLSYSQQRLWFLHQLHPDQGVYNLPLAYRIRGPLRVQSLEYAVNQVVVRHEVLRSVFAAPDGVPRQIPQEHAAVCIPVIDVSAAEQPAALAKQLAQEQARLPFEIASGPVLRASLVKLAPQDHLFLLTLHHIACDAWSLEIIGREISQFYNAHPGGSEVALPELTLQYPDFAEWQLRHLREPLRNELIVYWREHLQGIPTCINLPTDRQRPPVQSYDGAHVAFEIPNATVRAIDELARRLATTAYAVLLSAFAAVLHRHTGGEEVAIGTPVANRHDARLEPLIGFFSNTLVLRPAPSKCRSFAELVSAATAEIREALAHQELPFELLVEELQPQRDPAHSPIFQVLFMYWEGDHAATWQLRDCDVTAEFSDSGTAKTDLTLNITRTPTQMRVRLEYAKALFDHDTAERLCGHLQQLLQAALEAPDAEFAALPMLPPAELQQVLQEFAQGAAIPQQWQSMQQLFAAQVARTPSAIALIDGERTLTYRELDAASDALAARLRGLGVTRNRVVGVYLDRSVLTVVTLLGILKAGGGYLPLDPSYPQDRLAFMVEDSAAAIVVSRVALLAQAGQLGATVLPVDGPRLANVRPDLPSPAADDLAYLIYTSGSTGRPKGVQITQRNLATFLAAMNSTFGGDGPGTWLAVTSISFDISVLELLWTLTRGYRVVVRAEEPAPHQAGAQLANAHAASAHQVQRSLAKPQPAGKPVDFSLFFFGNAPADTADSAKRYRTLFEAARFADEHGFSAIWTPERHFHAFGGLYPNPSVLAAAIAVQTKRIGIRAGSVVLPLHDPLRVTEEWALVDNLSNGRVGVSFASGWQPDDFVLAPEGYANRKQIMLDSIAAIRRLWTGERISRRNGAGKEVDVAVYPRPVQRELPIWITSAQTPDTFRIAGEAGASILTHLIGHTVEQLAEKIALYREAWTKSGRPGQGHVTLMLHTFVGEDIERVKEQVRQPLKDYIRSSFDLMAGLGAANNIDLRQLPAEEVEGLLERGFERFFATSGLLGTPSVVADMVAKLAGIGIDEVGCLIDFGVADDATLDALHHLAAARAEYLRKHANSDRNGDGGGDMSIAEQLQRYQVTHLQCTPSLASVLVLDQKSRQALGAVKRLLVGGEALPRELAAALTKALGGSLHNMYGPTEATVWATTSEVTAGRPPLIGRPLPGYRAYVVDAALRPVPIGVPGELLLGGPAIAAGYHGRRELTAEKFITDDFSGITADRLYRTGDVVRWRANGELEFLGRVDHQVKLRGRRIELGEIEAALATHPAVQRAVCDVRGEGDAKRIVAYCTLNPGAVLPDFAELRAFLGRSLPDHMHPATCIALDSFPLTPNGKVNRRALPDPDQQSSARSAPFQAPANGLEETIAAIWRELLRKAHVGREDNFFSSGGNSVLVVALRSRLLEQLGGELSLVDIFRYPTIAALAAALAARSARPADTAAARAAEAGKRRRAASARNQARATATGDNNEQR